MSERNWRVSNRDAAFDADHRRKVARWGVQYEFVSRAAVLARDNWRCRWCGIHLTDDVPFPSPQSIALDHVVPYARGGPHIASNIVAACLACNQSKATKPFPKRVKIAA